MSSKFPSYNNKTLRFGPEVTRFHLHAVLPVTSMALISHRNVQNGPQTLFLTTVPGLQSLALILSLQGLLSLTPLPFHNLILNCRSKKTALPTILAINLGCRPESISTIPSLLEVLAVGGKSWHLSPVPPLLLHLTVLHARTQSGQ